MCRAAPAWLLLLSRVPYQNGIRVDRGALPPVLVRTQPEDGEVQMGRGGRGVAGAADVADHLSLPQHGAGDDALGVTIEMRVIVTPGAGRVELVDRSSAAPALEQLGYGAIRRG